MLNRVVFLFFMWFSRSCDSSHGFFSIEFFLLDSHIFMTCIAGLTTYFN